MFKSSGLVITIIAAVVFTLCSFIIGLEYRTVVGGDLKMLIPVDFIHVPKQAYKLQYQGDVAPDDFYCNSDSSESVSFLKLPNPKGNLDWCAQIMQGAFLSRATKTYFNDTTTINGNKMYVTVFEDTAENKARYEKFFFIKMRDSVIIGDIACNIKYMNEWIPVSEKILRSIKLN